MEVRLPHRLLFLFSFYLLCSFDLSAQTTMGKFARLLWYEGTRLNDTTLMSKKGNKVSYSPRKRKVTVTIDKKKDKFTPYFDELDKTGQRKKDAARILLQGSKGPLSAATVVQVNNELDRVHQSSEQFRNTTLELNAINAAPSEAPSSGNKLPPLPQWVIEGHRQVMDYSGKNGSEKNFDPPPPPSMDFDYCWECDSVRQRAYRQGKEQFMKEYLGEESEVIQKAISVMQYLALQEFNKQPYDSVTGQAMQQDLINAMNAVFGRSKNKIKAAWDKYSDDAPKLPFLTELVLGALRQEQLLGLAEDQSFISFQEVATKSTSVAGKYLQKAMNEKDYRVILNIRWILGLLRQSELLGGGLSRELDKTFYDFLQLSKFKISMDIDAKMGDGEVYQVGQMKGENYFRAVPDTNCVLQWMLVEPDPKNMKYKLERVEMVVPGAKPTYVGTRSWITGPADIRLDFCKEEKDTAVFFGFNPSDGKELWNMPQVGTMPMSVVGNIFNVCFMDTERLKRDAAKYEAEMGKMMKEMQEKHQKMIEPHLALLKKDPSKLTPAEIKKLNELTAASLDISRMVQAPSPFSYLIKSPLRNKQSVVLEERLDAKKLFPENTAIVYGYFNVKIEHAEK